MRMRFARAALLAVLTVALAAHGFDCGAMTTPEQAMQCCNSMGCSSHGHHGKDCCKTMPAMRAALGLPSSVHGISFSAVALGVLPVFNASHGIEPSARMVAAHSHAPPIFCSPAPPPLRI